MPTSTTSLALALLHLFRFSCSMPRGCSNTGSAFDIKGGTLCARAHPSLILFASATLVFVTDHAAGDVAIVTYNPERQKVKACTRSVLQPIWWRLRIFHRIFRTQTFWHGVF